MQIRRVGKWRTPLSSPPVMRSTFSRRDLATASLLLETSPEEEQQEQEKQQQEEELADEDPAA
jgi:hypothetical protein